MSWKKYVATTVVGAAAGAGTAAVVGGEKPDYAVWCGFGAAMGLIVPLLADVVEDAGILDNAEEAEVRASANASADATKAAIKARAAKAEGQAPVKRVGSP